MTNQIEIKNFQTGETKTLRIGDTVRYFQPGLQRYLKGKITKIFPKNSANMSNIVLESQTRPGIIYKTRAYILLNSKKI